MTNHRVGVQTESQAFIASQTECQLVKRGDLNSAGGARAYFVFWHTYIIYIHDKRAHYFSALRPGKRSLINQSTNSITVKSPT